jgi:hypothetical protein
MGKPAKALLYSCGLLKDGGAIKKNNNRDFIVYEHPIAKARLNDIVAEKQGRLYTLGMKQACCLKKGWWDLLEGGRNSGDKPDGHPS